MTIGTLKKQFHSAERAKMTFLEPTPPQRTKGIKRKELHGIWQLLMPEEHRKDSSKNTRHQAQRFAWHLMAMRARSAHEGLTLARCRLSRQVQKESKRGKQETQSSKEEVGA